MITQIIEIFSKIVKVKSIIDFLSKNIPTRLHIFFLYTILLFFGFYNQKTIQSQNKTIKLLKTGIFKKTAKEIAYDTQSQVRAEMLKQQTLNKDKMFATYHKEFKSNNQISILDEVFCYKNGFTLSQQACLNKNKDSLLPLFGSPVNSTIGLEARSENQIFFICNDLMKIHCNAFVYNKYSQTLPLIKDILNVENAYGYSCRLEHTQGIVFFTKEDLCNFDGYINKYICSASVFQNHFQAIFHIWNSACKDIFSKDIQVYQD